MANHVLHKAELRGRILRPLERLSWLRLCSQRSIRHRHGTDRDAGQIQVNAECRVENVDYKGWQAEQISNRWVQLLSCRKMAGD